MAAAIISGIAAVVGLGMSAAGGAAADEASKEQVKIQYERDKNQWAYENAKAKDQWNFEKAKINAAKVNNENELKFREESEKQNWEQQMSIRQASYDAKKDEYKAAEKEAKNQERLNTKEFENSKAQQSQWLEDQKTEKYFADEKASLALAQTMDKAEDLYGKANTQYGQTVRDINLSQNNAQRELDDTTRDLKVNNRSIEDQMAYDQEFAQLQVDQISTENSYLIEDETAAQAGFLNEQAQATHDLTNQIDKENLERNEQHAELDYQSDLAGYKDDFVKDDARIENQLAIDQKATADDTADNQFAMAELEEQLSQDTGDSNIRDLQNKLDKFVAGKNFEKESTWVKQLQATGEAAASGRAGMSAAAARQSVVAEMGRASAQLDDAILRGKKETSNLQDFERTKQAFATDKLGNQRETKRIAKDSAQSSFSAQTQKISNAMAQSEGETRRLQNRLGSKKEYVDAKSNHAIATFNDNFNLKTNDITARSTQSAIDAKRKQAKNDNEMAQIQKNLDKNLNAQGYNIVRNDNKMTTAADKYNAQKEAFDNQKLDAKENKGMAKADARRSVKIAKQNEKIDKKVREENLKSAKQQNKFDQKELKLGKLSADLKADAMRLPKPNIGPEIPQPFSYPRNEYVLPEKPIKAPKPIKGAANTSSMMQAIGSSLQGINWGSFIK